MDFLIKLKQSDLQTDKWEDFWNSDPPKLLLISRKAAFSVRKYSIENLKFLVFGDLIFPKEIEHHPKAQGQYLCNNYLNNSLYKLKGFYYIVLMNFENNHIEIHSCFLNILPVYYYHSDDIILVSGSLSEILKNLNHKPEPNQLYIVEKALFNYAFLNNTPYKNISLLPSCHFLTISHNGVNCLSNYNTWDFILENPLPWKNNLNALSELYGKQISAYIPDIPFAITLTGGFDGRTVLSAALQSKSEIHAFSYGSAIDPDVTIPQAIAKSLGFSYSPFLLDDNYAKNHFWKDGQQFLMKSEGAGNISRGHYAYTANELSQKNYQYLLTGNFGSELIRAMKYPGVMASEVLFALFDTDNKLAFENYVKKYNNLKFIDSEILTKNIYEVIDIAWNHKESLPGNYTKNQKFYTYMFGEVFRKYFGPEIMMQSDFILNRSPFLDFNIFKATLECNIAGIYQEFKEKSPMKRFHGQILYAHILKKLYPLLLDIDLDRNYKPKDFLTSFGRFSIIAGYINRNYLHKRNKHIPSYSQQLYEWNFHEIKKILEKSEVLNKQLLLKILDSGEWKTIQHEFVNLVSMESFYQNIITEKV